MSIYKTYDSDQLEDLRSNYMVDSWSYSKVSEFSRNQKAFEMSAIYGWRSKSSSTTIAGQAYHHALDYYFSEMKDGNILDLPTLEACAFAYIDEVKPTYWKLQKTTPTVDECRIKATKTVTQLLKNFYSEKSVYESDLEEILFVEVYCDEFLTINGVDVPLTCHAKIDLVIRTKSGLIVDIDHKSKSALSDEETLKLSAGVQAITYVKCLESKHGIKVDECWFIENKYSQNRSGEPQLNCFKIAITEDVRVLYEALLYEPLRSMIKAVSDPNHVYMINDADNYIDKAEIYTFWTKTMTCEVEDFNVQESKKDLVRKRLKSVRDARINPISPKIIKNFKENAATFIPYDLSNKDMTEKEKIEHALRSFGIIVNAAHQHDGYSSNTYLLEVSAGVKISSIHNHRLDIANVLNVSSVRISKELVVYENKSYVAIEFAKTRTKDLIFDAGKLVDLKLPIGVDNYGNTVVWDLNNHSTPHVLVCGATGSGKSVSVRSTIEYAKLAGINDIIIFDPKFEFMNFSGNGVCVINEILEIEEQMKLLVDQMNERVKSGKSSKTLVIFDEFADAVASARKGNELKIYEIQQTGMSAKGIMKSERVCTGELKSLEENLRVLLQKGRSSGYRVMAATQRASVKVITGDAKVNFPVQICFRVPKEADSRVVLDESGAESLCGMGDGLIKSPEYRDTVRFQAFFKP